MEKLIFLLIMVLALNGCEKSNELVIEELTPKENVLKSGDWHTLTQTQRNQAIIARAYQDNGNYVGLNCKMWASAVVSSASSNCTTLPTTAASPNDWYWNAGQYVSGRSGLMEYAVAGEIVQMKLTSGGPHTAIVYSVISTQLTFIESNWCSPATCNIVNLRTITFATFYGQVSNYTIYKIL